jgi:tetratricopeptide (TPR) repeat protein
MTQDLQDIHNQASDAMADGDKEKAIELYNEILTIAPTDEIALGQLMDLYFETDKFQYYLMRANYNVVNQKFEHAINDTKKALNLNADSIEARIKLARLYRVANKNLKSIDEFNKIIELAPDTKESYLELIDLYIIEDAKESAVGIAKKAVDEFSDDIGFKNILAKLYYDLASYEEALKFVTDRNLKAKILLQAGKNEEAKAVLDEMKPQIKEEKAAYKLLLAEYFYNKNEYNEALNVVNEYINLIGPSAVSFQMKALCYEGLNDEFMAAVNFGYMKKAQNKNDEAIVEFNHAHSLNKKDKNVLIELANLYMGLGEKYTAMDFWNAVYELDGDSHAKTVLGDFYFSEGDYRMAEKYGKVREGKESPNAENKAYAEADEEDEGFLNKIINFFSKK